MDNIKIDEKAKTVTITLSYDGYIDSFTDKKGVKKYVCDQIGSSFGGIEVPGLSNKFSLSAKLNYNPNKKDSTKQTTRQALPMA